MEIERESLERIRENEDYLRACTEGTAELDAALDKMEALKEPMTKLFRYYGSADWYEDREKPLPEDLSAGVLSEDLVYDEITAARDAALRMLEIATDILKNRI